MVVLVRGIVQPKSDRAVTGPLLLQSDNSPAKGVILQKSQTYVYEQLRGLVGWMTEREQISVSTESVPFVLAEGMGKLDRNFVEISLEGLRQPLPLTKVYANMRQVDSSWNRTALGFLLNHRLPVGLLDEEKVLRANTELTAVGHLFRSPEGAPLMKPAGHLPLFLTEMTREEVLASLASKSTCLFWGGLAATTLAAGVLGYAVYKNWRGWKREFERRRRQLQGAAALGGGRAAPPSAQQRNAAALLDDDEEEQVQGEGRTPAAPVGDGELCVVCLSRRRRAVFVHCGHRVCCCQCARQIQESSVVCPICREPVANVYRVFDA